MKRPVTRRDFLKLGVATAGVGLLQACSPAAQPTPAPQPTAVKPPAQTPQAGQPTAAPTQAPAAPTKAAGPKAGGTLTLARTMDMTEFHPLETNMGHYAFMKAIWNTLIHYDSKLQPQPELAEKWDFSSDGKQVTLKLRQGVKWHSGREFTSDDVKATWDFCTTEKTVTMRSMFSTIKKVDTPDKYTAVLNFDSPYAGVFDLLDMMHIIDKETIADRAKTAVGTGPFKLDKYVPSDRVEMVANKDYWDKGKPYLDKLVVRVIPDLASLAINLESGAVDAIWQPSNLDYVRLEKDGKFLCDLGAPGPTNYDLGINVTVKPFTDKRVRQAIAWAIDRERFCKTVLQGMVKPTTSIWASHSWAYFPDLEGKLGFDLDKAQSLLKEAGYPNGFDTEIMTYSKRGLGYGELPQIMQADLKKIGVNMKIDDVESAVYTARSNSGDIVMMMHSYGRANRDPGTTVTAAKAWYNEKEGNWTHWNNAEWDSLRAQLISTLDEQKRIQIARKLQEMALDECFTLVIAPQQRTWAYAPYVKGFGYNLENNPLVDSMWLDK
ncbi:MAG: ABC transporter substrate-binding protein [Chloroflexota bacterium]